MRETSNLPTQSSPWKKQAFSSMAWLNTIFFTTNIDLSKTDVIKGQISETCSVVWIIKDQKSKGKGNLDKNILDYSIMNGSIIM